VHHYSKLLRVGSFSIGGFAWGGGGGKGGGGVGGGGGWWGGGGGGGGRKASSVRDGVGYNEQGPKDRSAC